MTNLALIVIYIAIFIIIAVILIVKFTSKNNKTIDNNQTEIKNVPETMYVNGVRIQVSETEKEQIRQKEITEKHKKFEAEKRVLLSDIKNHLKYTDDIIKKKVLQELLKHPVNEQKDLDRLAYLYNDGELRSNEEIKKYDKYIANQKARDNFEKDRHKINILCSLVPCLIGIAVGFLVFNIPILNVLFAIVFGSLFGLLGSMLGNKINIESANSIGIPDDDPRVVDEKRKRAVGIAASAISGVAISKHAKQAAKDFLNVDSWKELK